MKVSALCTALLCAAFLSSCSASASSNSWTERFRIDKRGINHVNCASPCADAGDALYLTPYIDSGRIEEGRAAAAVKGLPGAGDHGGFSGFLTVNSTTNSNTFFWYVLC